MNLDKTFFALVIASILFLMIALYAKGQMNYYSDNTKCIGGECGFELKCIEWETIKVLKTTCVTSDFFNPDTDGVRCTYLEEVEVDSCVYKAWVKEAWKQ